MIVHGHPFTHRQPRIHRYVADWPARYVVDGRVIDKGWNPCQLCGRWHRIWITDDAVWKTLPPRLRPLRLCTPCFRRNAR